MQEEEEKLVSSKADSNTKADEAVNHLPFVLYFEMY